MAEFKVCIADPGTGKTYQKEVKDADAAAFIGKNIGESVKGELIGLTGAELLITGGSDTAGFPMRRGIRDLRKRLSLLGGVGLRRRMPRGARKRKTVCGHKISDRIAQVNVKVSKEGSKKLAELFPPEKAEEKKQ